MTSPNILHTAAENASNAAPVPAFQIAHRPGVSDAPAKPEALDLAERRHAAAVYMLRQAESALWTCRAHRCDDTAALLAVERAQAAVNVEAELLIEALDAAAGRVAA